MRGSRVVTVTATVRYTYGGTTVYRQDEELVIGRTEAEARARVMMGATMAGLAFGVAGTAAAHAIQYPVGALTHTAHGAGVACLIPYVMAWNATEIGPELDQIATAIGRITHCTRGINYLGLPALAVPCGFTPGGLPASFQLVGRPFSEAVLLQTGDAYQRRTDFHLRVPPECGALA